MEITRQHDRTTINELVGATFTKLQGVGPGMEVGYLCGPKLLFEEIEAPGEWSFGPFGDATGYPLMKTKTDTLDRAGVLLSVQRALLMAITPEMRVVDVAWNDSEIRLRFVLAKEGEDDLIELTNEVEAEVEADFLPAVRARSVVEYLPVGTPVPLLNRLDGGYARVFARREGEPF